ncbi:MAG: alpha/beta hydrolase [Solobacterium sp.]|nr:alpha/beta hydrolase [Solobacterium sp.]
MIIKRDLYYWPAQENRTLHIYLPDDYYYTNERYPVMYMFDGHNLFFDEDATYGKCWGIKDFLDHYSKKMIVVGMECSHHDNDRLNEYSPYHKRMFGQYIEGMGEKTFEWIMYNVKPMIDSEYRTYGFREATGIGGSSMGGLMSIYGIIRHNQVFSKAACLSTGIFHNISNLRKDLASSDISPDTKIYMSWGEIESGRAAHNGNPAYDTREARSVRKFERELQERNADTYIYFQPGGRHCEEDWQKQVPLFMNYLWLNIK